MSTASRDDDASVTTAQAVEQLKSAGVAADARATDAATGLQRIHQARLAQQTRLATTLAARYGADDTRVAAARAAAAAAHVSASRASLMRRQLELPAAAVDAASWALQGHVFDAQLQPMARCTVFLVDTKKSFLREYGYAYTDSTGYFVLTGALDGNEAAARVPPLFIEVVDTKAAPVYLADAPFVPVAGSASYQEIVLVHGKTALGDPPAAIRAIAMPPVER